MVALRFIFWMTLLTSGSCLASGKRLSKQLQVYGNLRISHHSETLIQSKQEKSIVHPMMQTRLRLGALLENKHLDIYASAGIVKKPQSQNIVVRRTQLATDAYLLRLGWFSLRQFNRLIFPTKEAYLSAQSQTETADPYLQSHDNTLIVIGFAPAIYFVEHTKKSSLEVLFNSEVSTFLFTQPQSITTEEDIELNEEDREQRVKIQPSIRLHYQPHIAPKAKLALSGTYRFLLYPKYQFDPGKENQVSRQQGIERRTLVTLGFSYDTSSKITVRNELTSFQYGFFQKRPLENNLSYRNVLRLIYKF